MLNPLQARLYTEVCDHFAGSCMAYTNDFEEDYGLTEDEVEEILIEADIEMCVVCGWWQYSGEYCSEHDHDEITCMDCCEDMGQEA